MMTVLLVLVIVACAIAALGWHLSVAEIMRHRAARADNDALWQSERIAWGQSYAELEQECAELRRPADRRVMKPPVDPAVPCCAFCGAVMPADAVRFHTGIYLMLECKAAYLEACQ